MSSQMNRSKEGQKTSKANNVDDCRTKKKFKPSVFYRILITATFFEKMLNITVLITTIFSSLDSNLTTQNKSDITTIYIKRSLV